MPPVFQKLSYWYDDQPRTGAENMAADQILLENVDSDPLLRVYQWSEPTVSFGYFLQLTDAKKAFPGGDVKYIRRWTGGGIVDHRHDLTYTLVIPRMHPLAQTRGGESYLQIHQVLAQVLAELGCSVSLGNSDQGGGGLSCFTNPVEHDLLDQEGNKIAGAGQRRTRHGMLHQGSLQVPGITPFMLGEKLAVCLSGETKAEVPESAFWDKVEQLANERYASHSWLEKT